MGDALPYHHHHRAPRSAPRARLAGVPLLLAALMAASVVVGVMRAPMEVDSLLYATYAEFAMSLQSAPPRSRLSLGRRSVATKHERFLEWDAPGVRDGAGALREDFGGIGVRTSETSRDASDPVWLLQHELEVPIWRYNTSTCAYLAAGTAARASVGEGAAAISRRWLGDAAFVDLVIRAGETRASLARRGVIQNANLARTALAMNAANVTEAHDELQALFGETWAGYWDETSVEGFVEWITNVRRVCDDGVPPFIDDDVGTDGSKDIVDDADGVRRRFWRAVNLLHGTDEPVTMQTIEEDMLEKLSEADQVVRLDGTGVLDIDEHVIGSWLSLRAYELGKRGGNKITTTKTTGSDKEEVAMEEDVDRDILSSVPDFSEAQSRLAIEPLSALEVRGICAVAASCKPFHLVRDYVFDEGWEQLYPASCAEARKTSPSLFSPQASFDTLHAFAWGVPMLVAQRTLSRPAFISSLMRAARLCQASSSHYFLMLHCSHGIGHAVVGDTHFDIRPTNAFTSPVNVDALWRRFRLDATIISSGARAPEDDAGDDSYVSEPFTYVLDCVHYGRAVSFLGGDSVFASEACLTGFYHQLLVHDIGFKDNGDLRGRRTDAILGHVRATRRGRQLDAMVSRALSGIGKDSRVLVVMLHHCFNLAEAYLDLLLRWDEHDEHDEREDGRRRTEWLSFTSALKSGVSGCFYNTGFFSSYDIMYGDGKPGVAARLKQVLMDLFGSGTTSTAASNDEDERMTEDEKKEDLKVVMLEACHVLGASNCEAICDRRRTKGAGREAKSETARSDSEASQAGAGDESTMRCLSECRNVSRAYVSPLCWHGAGAAEVAGPITAFNRCRGGCLELGCNRREFEYCTLGYMNRREAMNSASPDRVNLQRYWRQGGVFLEMLAKLFDAHHDHKTLGLPVVGTRLLDGVRAFERYRNTTLPNELSI